MGCNCGKKKGVNNGVTVFSTAEQAKIAKDRNVRVLTSAGSSNGRKTESGTDNA